MTTETVSNAVAKRDTGPDALVQRYEQRFADVLPEHLPSKHFVGLAQGALLRNSDLRKAAERSPGSWLNALLDCARLGHEPGTEAYYLVPFGDEVVGIEGYRGEIERIYRAGAVASVIAEVVYEHDSFRYVPGAMDRPEHEVDWDAEDRGKLRLVYAYAVMKDRATSRVVVLNRADIDKRRAVSRGATGKNSPWVKWESSMWLKSAIHELEKWVPTSSEYRREQLRAALAVQAEQANGAPPPVGNTPAIGPAPVGDEPVEAELLGELPADNPADRPVSDPQLRKLHASFSNAGITDRDKRLAYCAFIAQHPVTSTNDLTFNEASWVIDALANGSPGVPSELLPEEPSS